MNISSIVVKCRPEFMDTLIEKLNASELCEVHHRDDKGQIVVVIEGEDVSVEISKLKAIESMDHVITADMMYSYSEEELMKAREELGQPANAVPDVLQDETLPAESIGYSGQVKDL
ncbi:MAG: chaperone NapD [Spirochaetota bacterium]|nr:chaperone NapD [Spirochaetota bacterium]